MLSRCVSYAYENGGDIQIMTISRGCRVCIVFKDNVSYRYENGQNVLTIEIDISQGRL